MTALTIAAILLATAMAVWRIGRRTHFFLHILQLQGYKTHAYTEWLSERVTDAVLRSSHLVGGVLLVVARILAGGVGTGPGGVTLALALLWAITFASSRRYRRETTKKPFAATARMKRLTAAALSMEVVIVGGGAALWAASSGPLPVSWYFGGLWFADLAAPLLVRAAAGLTSPVERRIHEGFKRQARARLAARTDLTTVAITGSYGKTSTKFAVHDVLSQRYPVLATPGSFNTPMGICRVVNNRLRGDHRYLVLEMGIRNPGDIAELCDIARPDIAVITSVGVAHLESMGSVEAIAREKGSLLDFLRPGGIAVLNIDDEEVRAMIERAPGRVLTVATDPALGADLTATDISYGPSGTSFTVTESSQEAPTGKAARRADAPSSIRFETGLLGRHNVTNILLALAVGRAAGLRLRQMRHAAVRMKPTPHRLELKKEGPVTVIDDAFNSNPVGAANALEILSGFTGGRRVIITPGMIELGHREEDLNRAFGRQIADAADYAILVGPERTRPILAGLGDRDFPEDRIHVTRSLFEAREWIRSHLGEGDVVLYENDLPDQFDES